MQRFGLIKLQFGLGFHRRRLQMPTHSYKACGVFRRRTGHASVSAKFHPSLSVGMRNIVDARSSIAAYT